MTSNFMKDEIEVQDIWVPLFATLSIERFEPFWESIGLIGVPNPKLRDICKDFIIYYYICLGRIAPVKPTILYLDVNPESEIALLDLSNSALKEIRQTCGETYITMIHQWVKRHYSHQKEQPKNGIYNQFYGGEWAYLLRGWASNSVTVNDPPLSSQQIIQLKQISETYYVESFTLNEKIKQIALQNEWELFVDNLISLRAWVSIQAQYILEAQFWEKVFDILSDEALKILQHWAWELFKLRGMKILPSLTKVSIL